MLCGVEENQCYQLDVDGILCVLGVVMFLEVGQVEKVFVDDGDIYCVSNVLVDCVFISIYVYGGNIGVVKCVVYILEGQQKLFIFGYFNCYLFNIWDFFCEY